ncbi:WD40-repeat-containing domain protein [Umbelopsis sp. PMI_123]|nr:WD40-repeat-containing domain protein [Umbelopsis sp. PMI_123]
MTTARYLIWSPHEEHNQFLVGSSELKLYEWLPEEDGVPARTQLISSIPIPNITLMMCADWSPDPDCNDLIAVGMTTGRTVLVRMNEHTYIDQSPRLWTQGDTTISPRRGSSRAPVPSGSPQIPANHQYPVLPVKSSRACNVVKFSPTHPNLLAVGLDKARNESCLMVWDVSQASTLDESRSAGTMTPLATAEAGQSSPIVNTWKPTGPGAFDANERFSQATGVFSNVNVPSKSTKIGEQKLMQQYGSAEAITSCAWLNEISAPLLIAGMGGKWLRLYDIRLDATTTPLSIQDKAVYGLITDPYHSHRIASYTEDGVIKLWDIRKPDDAVLSINVDHSSGSRTPLSRILFAPSKRGLLASLSRDANAVDLWDIQETGPTVAPTKMQLQRSASPFEMTTPTANIPLSADVESPITNYGLPNYVGADEEVSIPLLWRSRRTKPSTKALASFSFIPNASCYFSHAHSSVQGLLTLTKDGIFDTLKVQQIPNMTWEPKGGILATEGMRMTEYSPHQRSTPVLDKEQHQDNIKKLHAFGINQSSVSTDFEMLHISSGSDENGKTSSLANEAKIPAPTEIRFNKDPTLSAALDRDISVLMRKRATHGYSMNSRKNLEIVDHDPKLKELWLWMHRAETLSHGKAQIGNVDYSFQGVLGVWLGPTHNRRSSPSSTPRTSTNSPPTPLRQRISQRLPNDSSSEQTRSSPAATTPPQTPSTDSQLYMVQTARLQQRHLALTICGFAFTADQLEAELVRLESTGEYDTAAGWALFNGLPDRAIKALSSQRGKSLGSADEQQRKLMSAVLAGYQANRESMNPTWQELCKSLSEDMVGRPYLKAIFAYIASNDWSVILNMKELPLCERMSVALRILEDDEVSYHMSSENE